MKQCQDFLRGDTLSNVETSQSVWFEQVDTALITLLQKIITLRNQSGELISVPAMVRKVDEDFEIEKYPSVSVYNLYSRLDRFRYFPLIPTAISRDTENHTVVMEESSIPFKLTYQIDFWSLLQGDMNDMLRKWLSYAGNDFNLYLKDMSGIERSSFVIQKDTLRKQDILEGEKRIFHSMLTYDVWVEIDERVQKTEPMVSSIGVDVVKK